jgi:L-seryl-tRNA(Ser) seleniumtransferase
MVSYNTVPRGVVPLEDLIELGEKYDVPVVVDAASDLPPVSNLHKYTDMGADVICFSGGKAIKAPNNTGFMVGGGRGADIVEAVRDHTFPHSGWGRGHKISKEQIVGLVVALEIFVDEGDSLYAGQMAMAQRLAEELRTVPGLEVEVIPNDETYHEHPTVPHVPRVLMRWNMEEAGMSAEELDAAVARDDPPVYLRNVHYYDYYTDKEWRLIDVFYLRPEEERIVVDKIVEAFRGG